MGSVPSSTFISANDIWVLWAALIVFAAASIYLEQNYKCAEHISGPVIRLIFAGC